ncbi:MAG TPA: PIN domain-containing protein [Solirubrobacterales bacterium]|nr:PIN domain-containing protein [Solirubrobacterales bacterium]
MGSLALDASVAIALFTEADTHHDRALVELDAALDRDEVLSMAASAYSEIMVHAARSGQGELIDRFVDRLRMEVVPVDREIGRRAAELGAKWRSLRLPDALVLATAQTRRASLLSFDTELARLARELDLASSQS